MNQINKPTQFLYIRRKNLLEKRKWNYVAHKGVVVLPIGNKKQMKKPSRHQWQKAQLLGTIQLDPTYYLFIRSGLLLSFIFFFLGTYINLELLSNPSLEYF